MAKTGGWFRESRRHSLASRGIETGRKTRTLRVPRAPTASEKRGADHRIETGGSYWNIACNPDGSNATLRMDDPMGWRWDGDEDSWDIFLMRMAKSRVADEFLKAMEDSGLDYSAIRKMITDEDYDLDSAVYSLTGDNVFWHFGEMGDADYDAVDNYAREDLSLDGKEKEAFHDYFWREADVRGLTDFDAYKKETAKYSDDGSYNSVKRSIREAFKNANDWSDVISEFSSEDRAYDTFEAQNMWINSVMYPELQKVGKKFVGIKGS